MKRTQRDHGFTEAKALLILCWLTMAVDLRLWDFCQSTPGSWFSYCRRDKAAIRAHLPTRVARWSQDGLCILRWLPRPWNPIRVCLALCDCVERVPPSFRVSIKEVGHMYYNRRMNGLIWGVMGKRTSKPSDSSLRVSMSLPTALVSNRWSPSKPPHLFCYTWIGCNWFTTTSDYAIGNP